ncbi:hypothetical protein Pan258_45230 [Symmachiella dynata]|nr:hypothetical protein Pan258_45230 [Symmachiella dynata]
MNTHNVVSPVRITLISSEFVSEIGEMPLQLNAPYCDKKCSHTANNPVLPAPICGRASTFQPPSTEEIDFDGCNECSQYSDCSEYSSRKLSRIPQEIGIQVRVTDYSLVAWRYRGTGKTALPVAFQDAAADHAFQDAAQNLPHAFPANLTRNGVQAVERRRFRHGSS